MEKKIYVIQFESSDADKSMVTLLAESMDKLMEAARPLLPYDDHIVYEFKMVGKRSISPVFEMKKKEKKERKEKRKMNKKATGKKRGRPAGSKNKKKERVEEKEERTPVTIPDTIPEHAPVPEIEGGTVAA